VTLLAARAEVQRAMIRIRRAVEIRLMTADAISRQSLIPAIDVTLAARRGLMRARQRESRRVVAEGRRPPRRGRVARLTLRRKS
jgi:hypothetical protein